MSHETRPRGSASRLVRVFVALNALGLAASAVAVALDRDVSGATALLGTVFLALTVFPGALLRSRYKARAHPLWARLRARRRILGIATGAWCLAHTACGVAIVLERDPARLLSRELAAASLAALLLAAMLVTSLRAIQRCAPWWRTLHRFVWCMMPVALLHGLTVKWRFEQEIAIPALVLLVPPMAVAFLVRPAPSGERAPDRRVLVYLGAFAFFVLYELFPATPLGG